MKKLLKIVLSVFMVMALAIQLPVNLVSVVNAYGGMHVDYDWWYEASDDLTYYGIINDDNTVELVLCYFADSFDEETLVIPGVMEGYTVTTIGRAYLVQGDYYEERYYNYELPETVTSVVVPDTVTTIEAYAFYHCTSLESIIIPSNVVEIGEYAFTDSQVLYVYEDSYALQYAKDNGYNYVIIENTSLGETYVEDTENPGYYFVYEVISEEDKTAKLVDYYHDEEAYPYSVNIPSILNGYTVTTIGSYAFDVCGDIQVFTIPDTVTTFEDYAFTNCWNYTMTIPASVINIGEYAISEYFVGTLRVYSNSVALQYAIDNNIKYVIIDDTEDKEGEKAFDVIFEGVHASASYSLNELLTEEELNNDSYIEFILSVYDANDTVTDEEKAIIENILGEYIGIQYLDINLMKNVDGVLSDISSTSSNIMVIVDLPESLMETVGDTEGKYVIVRLHDGVAEILEDLDDVDYTVTFETDKFSTYAIAFIGTTDTTTSSVDSTTDTTTTTTGSVQTGDESQLAAYALLGGIALLGVLYIRKKRYN